MDLLDFVVIDRLYLPPQLADSLFLVVIRKNLLKPFESDYLGRQYVTPQNRFELRRRAADQSKPDITRKHLSGIGEFVLLIIISHYLDRGSLLVLHPVAQLRAHRRPICRAYIGFVSR